MMHIDKNEWKQMHDEMHFMEKKCLKHGWRIMTHKCACLNMESWAWLYEKSIVPKSVRIH